MLLFLYTFKLEYKLKQFKLKKKQDVACGGAEFKKIPNAPGGRVYYFKFNQAGIANAFFWMQDPITSEDSLNENKIVQALVPT